MNEAAVVAALRALLKDSAPVWRATGRWCWWCKRTVNDATPHGAACLWARGMLALEESVPIGVLP